MDNISFTFVSAMAALGGAMGTFVGFKKLSDTRAERMMAQQPPPVDHRVGKFDYTMLYAHDFARTVGYLGIHSVYGMVVYPWMPLYLLGSSLRRDARR